ncbi:MAG TPA: DUF2752 domain-containing protein [Mycobacteriales bacterium]|nr:DUF2752 domain-containing protein [Mycobacteriales bacterium]
MTTASAAGSAAALPPVRVSRAALRYLVLGAALLALAGLHVRRPATLCLLRATTGVPCPFCGGTTSAVALGRGDLAGALRASVLAPLLLVVAPVPAAAARVLGRLPRPAAWAVVVAALTVAEVWQLDRFGLI